MKKVVNKLYWGKGGLCYLMMDVGEGVYESKRVLVGGSVLYRAENQCFSN